MTETQTQDPPADAGTDGAAAAAPHAKPKAAAKGGRWALPACAVRVTYDTLGEFLGELSGRGDELELGIVRVAVLRDPPGRGVGQQLITCIAGAVVRGQVLEVVEVAGSDWNMNTESDRETQARSEAWLNELAEVVRTNGWELRGGRFGAL